ncbi:MAG: hypothetical protein Q9227_000515 [Pyrenula ochraceoflavens]
MASVQRPKRPQLSARRYSSASSKFDPRLGAIDEDGGMQPDTPTSSYQNFRRPLSRLRNLSIPHYHISRPFSPSPLSSDWSSITGPGGEKFGDIRGRQQVNSRGGWKRIFFLVGISILLIAGLIVGLVLGLRSRNHGKHSSSAPAETQDFPAGTYSITTFLAAVKTSCTSNPATWRCYPYTVYATNDSSTYNSSAATLTWTIAPDGHSDSKFLISSSENPFAPTFVNASLTTVDVGSNTQAYYFSVPGMQKLVIPTVALTSDGSTDQCYYNETVFEAWLYTKIPKSYPDMEMSRAGGTDQQWPHAVKIQETISSGTGVPDCYKSVNGMDESRVDIATGSANGQCGCTYQNYGA